jgi:hypothetical protein
MCSLSRSIVMGDLTNRFASGSKTRVRGLWTGNPVMIVNEAYPAREEDSKWFRTDCTSGIRRGYWEDSSIHSEVKDRKSFPKSLLTFSTVPLTHGEYAVIMWRLIWTIWLNSWITLSLKWNLGHLRVWTAFQIIRTNLPNHQQKENDWLHWRGPVQ